MIYRNISDEKVNSVHKLFYLLRFLKIIGVVHTKIYRPYEQDGYTMLFIGYDRSFKNKLTSEEKIETYFKIN